MPAAEVVEGIVAASSYLLHPSSVSILLAPGVRNGCLERGMWQVVQHQFISYVLKSHCNFALKIRCHAAPMLYAVLG